jgi:hypothetical protein
VLAPSPLDQMAPAEERGEADREKHAADTTTAIGQNGSM